MATFPHQDFLSITQLRPKDAAALVASAAKLKAEFATHRKPRLHVGKQLAGRSIAVIFEKPSLRTRLSFEVGIHRLGGQAIIYDTRDQRIGVRETTKDVARNLDKMVHAIVARTFAQRTLEELAEYGQVPVINALSDDHHPCQALADALTITERAGKVKGNRVCFIGDGNNVCRSLAEIVCKLGGHMVVITPPGHALGSGVVAAVTADAAATGGSLMCSTDPADVRGCAIVYSDEWASMHHADAAARVKPFTPYQVSESVMKLAGKSACFMHCLPAARGKEVTDAVIDGPNSLVYQQAENRIYAQQAVLLALLAR